MNIPKNAFQRGVKNPKKALQYLYRRFLYKQPYIACRRVNQKYHQQFRDSGNLDIMEEDWDTLLLIDACRYDYFSEESELPGELDSRRSPGSMSLEFIENSFVDRELHDTVYVTANPFAMEIESGTFHDIVSLVDEYYDNKIGTVPPEDLTTVGKKAHEDYPQKRIIVHYMQPHEPFLSDFGQTVSERLRWAGNQYHLPRDMNITELQKAYRENIRLVLNELEDFIECIDGKVVVSADHGELLGERLSPIPIRGLEHPQSIYEEKLLEVPWLEIDSSERRKVKSESPKERKKIASDTAEKRLKQLGYL